MEMEKEELNAQNIVILKELTDMGKLLAVIDNRIKNVENTQIEAKLDIREIKNDFVNRREFNEAMKTIQDDSIPSVKSINDHETRIRAMEAKVWKFIGGLIICQVVILPILLYLFFRSIK